jgi:hypothetical protein
LGVQRPIFRGDIPDTAGASPRKIGFERDKLVLTGNGRVSAIFVQFQVVLTTRSQEFVNISTPQADLKPLFPPARSAGGNSGKV